MSAPAMTRAATRSGVVSLMASRIADDARAVRPRLLREQSLDVFRGNRPAEQKALRLVTAQQPQQLRLLLGLDALGHHLEAQRLRKRDHGADDARVVRILGHP